MQYKSDVEALVLAALAQCPQHGYGLVKAIQGGSSGLFRLNEGRLYPLLHKMQAKGWIAGTWESDQTGPARKTYTLLESGAKELEARRADWDRFSQAVSAVLSAGERPKTEVQHG